VATLVTGDNFIIPPVNHFSVDEAAWLETIARLLKTSSSLLRRRKAAAITPCAIATLRDCNSLQQPLSLSVSAAAAVFLFSWKQQRSGSALLELVAS
jgi:hypothetical protein